MNRADIATILRKNEVELLKQTRVPIVEILETLEVERGPHASNTVRGGLRDMKASRRPCRQFVKELRNSHEL